MHKDKKFTINEIVLKIFKLYPDLEKMYNLQVIGQLNKKSSFAQCCAEIGARYVSSKSFPVRVSREKNNKGKYIYFISTNLLSTLDTKPIIITVNEDESTLYPLLNQYLRHIGIRSKRINEKKSRNSKGAGGNKWLHPDLVGYLVATEIKCDRTFEELSILSALHGIGFILLDKYCYQPYIKKM